MPTDYINLFTIDVDNATAIDLKHYLELKFGIKIVITNFIDVENCINKINSSTHLVILSYNLYAKNGLKIINLIKQKNSKTQVVVLSNNESISIAIKAITLSN